MWTWPVLSSGSSPLTRGGRGGVINLVLQSGLIPAYAGRTCAITSSSRWRRAHPRLRGADSGNLTKEPVQRGSSPLTRGGRPTCMQHIAHPGLIPAYAGRTEELAGIIDPDGAHPRLRGADDVTFWGKKGENGSSPLTRGGLLRKRRRQRHDRLIPAYAGRTVDYGGPSGVIGAHPRLRGADQLMAITNRDVTGSSPLTRGGLH
ncbi:hypothetical protein U2A4042520098 [Corynebacterium striatum]|nr:hypothetical protein U2A4042520098 [Corynebacterium striatum]